MSTFLVNPKMDAALAARVEAAVSGRRGQKRKGVAKSRIVALSRVVAVVVVVFAVQAIVKLWRRDREEVTRARQSLVDALRSQGEGVTDADRRAARRIETLLVDVSRAFDKDVMTPNALDGLREPFVYVRGPIGSFANPDTIAAAASTSGRDALVACLLDPPATRAQKDVAAKTWGIEAKTAHVRRLHELEVGLPLLAPEVLRKAEKESDLPTLLKMKRDLDRAPIDGAKRGARARLLLAAMDEPGEGATELDGERRHHVRVALVDVVTGAKLVDVRRLVDPSWISADARPMHARAYDSCLLALDIRAAAAR